MSDSELHPTGAEKPKKKRGFRYFCIELWWVHVIATIVITLCVTLPLVYVAYPKIAQDDVNKSKLTITQMSITKPRPDGFHLNLTTSLENKALFHPNLRAWNGSLYLPNSNQSYLTLEIPAFVARNGALTHIDREITLGSAQLDEFGNYLSVMVANTTVNNFLIGRGPLKLGALPVEDVNYNKSLSMAGFDGLKGIEITDSKLLTGTQPDNATLAGTVHIPNTSGGTVELGNLTFGLSLPADVLGTDLPTAIGYATVNNTILLPGADNTFDLRSVANQTLVTQAVVKNTTYLKTGLPLTIVTRKVEFNGEEITWLTTALSANPIQQLLNVSEILANSQTKRSDDGWDSLLKMI